VSGGDDYRQHVHFFPSALRVLMRFRPDIVHADEEPYSLCAMQFALLSRWIGASFVFRGAQTLVKRFPVPFRWGEQLTFYLADAAQARSEQARAVLVQKGFSRPVHVIGHSVDTSDFRPGEAEGLRYALGLTGSVVLYVGRLSDEKGVEDLVMALWILHRQGCEVTGVIVGSGPLEAALRARIEGLNLTSLIRMVPAVPHGAVAEYVRAADVVAVPSRTTSRIVEQFGRVVIEALACERPVVGSSAGEVPRLLARTGGGLVFREGDVDHLAHCLKTLLDDPERRRTLARRGRAVVVREYSTEAEAAQLRQMYAAVLGGTAA
jgi:glycosyltransferase involved in cell wall biosynthesis